MPLTLSRLDDPALAAYDAVIDARSPAEYADDHLPGAINLPVLDDDERARVGTIYKQQSPFLARKVGAALVARNVARHLEGPLADLPGSWRALVYCWRGGQRSGSFATILTQVGWRIDTLAGGYKAWRGLVIRDLAEEPLRAPLTILDGNTGTAKTEILQRLRDRGVQVIDLEALAHHRGSLFGHRPGGQPSQRSFEGRLASALAAVDPGRPLVVEAESSRIGDIGLPKQLWAAMREAPRIRIAAPLAARARYLARTYADVTADPAALAARIDSLRPLQPADRIAGWHALADAGRHEDLAAELMRDHYDLRYEKHRARFARPDDVELVTEGLEPAEIDILADRVAGLLGRPQPG